MTLQTNGHTTVGPLSHEHASATGDAHLAHPIPATGRRGDGAGVTALGTLLALPRTVRIIGGAGVVIGALLAVGVPLATLTPLLLLGGCLSMHLFMGHGMSHGEGHGQHGTTGAAGAGPAEDTSPRRDG